MLRVGPEKMRKKSWLSLIITAHFCCVIGSDIIVTFQVELMIVRYIVQTTFLFWSIFLCCTFLYAGYKVIALLKMMPREMLLRVAPDNSHKGIMQLAMLAPYNNLASCLTAALMPTLLAPKIRVTDENDQSFSVGSDTPNIAQHAPVKPDSLDLPSRALPGSSPTTRRRSNVNVSNPSDPPAVYVRPPTPVSVLPPASIFSSRRESASSYRSCDLVQSRRGSNISQIPEQEREREKGSATDLSERRGSNLSTRSRGTSSRSMPVVEEHKGARRKSDLRIDVTCDSRRGSNLSQNCVRFEGDETTERTKNTRSTNADAVNGDGCVLSQSGLPDPDVEGKEEEIVVVDKVVGDPTVINGKEWSENLAVAAASKHGTGSKEKGVVERGDSKKKGKKEYVSDDEIMTELLPQRSAQTSDVTLNSILNHIAYVNRANSKTQLGVESNDRKSQVRRVLHVTYGTAILGLILCITDIIRIYGPFGLMATLASTNTNEIYNMNSEIGENATAASEENSTDNIYYLNPWPWFCFQTLCRLVEFAMGCAMANITKQPTNKRQHLFSNIMIPKHRESLYV